MDDKFEDLQPGDLTLTAGGDRTPYELLAEMEPLKAHISKISRTMGTKYGTDEPQLQLVIGYKIDEEEGRGQVYNAYYTATIAEKSKLLPVVIAALGEVDGPLDPTALNGKTVRIMLETYTNKTGETRQKVKSVLKPAKGQVIFEETDTSDAEVVENYEDLF